MKITVTNSYLEQFELISPSRGGIKLPRWTLSTNTESIRINKYAIKEEDLWNEKFVEIRALKEENRIIMLIRFSDNKNDLEDAFKIASYEDENKNRSMVFTTRGVFRKFEINAKDITKNKSIILKPEKKEIDGSIFYAVEIPLKN